jgi:hypothetical protein
MDYVGYFKEKYNKAFNKWKKFEENVKSELSDELINNCGVEDLDFEYEPVYSKFDSTNPFYKNNLNYYLSWKLDD